MSGNNYWTDRRQDRRIEEAEAQLASERRARNRLAQQMREQQGNLQGQISRLTTALVALIEHEDIRAELGQYADAAACRRYARDVVSTVVVTGGAALRGSVVPTEVPGYWLSSAARGVAAVAQGEPGGEGLLTRARQDDPQRTALFLTLLGAATQDPRWAGADLARVLPDEASVSAAQRQLWLAIADGRLSGNDGDPLAQLEECLRRQVGAAADATERTAAWVEQQSAAARSAVPAERAADQLAAVRRVLAAGTAAPDPTDTRVVQRLLTTDATPDDGDRQPVAEDPLADCLRSLVDEGSPGEGDILDRMARVRADLGFLDERAASRSAAWSTPAGDVLDLLLRDLGEGPDEPGSALARRVLAPTLTTVADTLAQQAAAPPDDQRSVKVVGEIITVRDTGATSDWRAGVAAAVVRRNPRPPYLFPAGIALLVVGVLGLGLAFVSSGFLVLAFAGLVGGAGLLVSELTKRRATQELQEATLRSTERQVGEAAAAIKDEAARSSAALSRATDDRRAVQEILARP